MRHIGNVPTEFDAVRLGDHLFMMGIEVQVEPEGGEWAVWAREEDKVESARQELQRYREAPRDPRYDSAQAAAAAKRLEQVQQRRKAMELQVDAGEVLRRATPRRRPVVLAIAILCALVFIVSGERTRLNPHLSFTAIRADGRAPADGWSSIKSGQVWRLVTPAFIHLSISHLIMNMLAFHYFGGAIEDRRGAVYLAIMILVTAVISNVVQYSWTHSPYFGGFSGVVFGLFGYAWIMTERRPESGIVIGRDTIIMTMIFYSLCILSGMEAFADSLGKWLPPVANACHTGGLLTGLAWGFFDSRR
ncbi:MAG: rhomboid family intramembrane serine protease [Pirellulales bacterium]